MLHNAFKWGRSVSGKELFREGAGRKDVFLSDIHSMADRKLMLSSSSSKERSVPAVLGRTALHL